jgi:hypothetical protein
MRPDLLQLEYDSRFCVKIPQRNYKPVPSLIDIEAEKYAPPFRKHEWFPGMEPLFLQMAKQRIVLAKDRLKKNAEVGSKVLQAELLVKLTFDTDCANACRLLDMCL